MQSLPGQTIGQKRFFVGSWSENPSNPIDILREGKHYLSLNPCIIDTAKQPSEHILYMEHDT
jgi:hypothetical protein